MLSRGKELQRGSPPEGSAAMTEDFAAVSENLSRNLPGLLKCVCLKGTGFSPYMESDFWCLALAAEGMRTSKNPPSEAKAQSFVRTDVRAEARTFQGVCKLSC